MDITLTPTAELMADLAITLTPADYQAGYEKRLKAYGQKAQIKGFRPGKVPPALLKKLYGKGLLMEEVNATLQQGLNAYIKEQKIRLLGDPLPAADQEPVDLEPGQDFTFKFEIGQLPEVTLPAAGTVAVTRYNISVDDATLQDTLDQVSRQFGETATPETVEMGDYVAGVLRRADGSFSTKTLLPTVKLAAEQDKFIGAKMDDVVAFDLQAALGNDAKGIAILAGVTATEAAALTGEFEYVVNSISRTAAPELNQELFDKIFGPGTVTTEEEFRQKVRETVQENYVREAEKLFSHQVVDAVVNGTPVALPESFFKKWLFANNEGKLTTDQIDANIGQYSGELKWSLIRNAVMEDQKLNVTAGEIRERATQQMLDQFGMAGADGELREQVAKFADQQLKQDNGKLYRDTFEAIVADKVVAYLKGLVVVTDSDVTAEEFRTMSV